MTETNNSNPPVENANLPRNDDIVLEKRGIRTYILGKFEGSKGDGALIKGVAYAIRQYDDSVPIAEVAADLGTTPSGRSIMHMIVNGMLKQKTATRVRGSLLVKTQDGKTDLALTKTKVADAVAKSTDGIVFTVDMCDSWKFGERELSPENEAKKIIASMMKGELTRAQAAQLLSQLIEKAND